MAPDALSYDLNHTFKVMFLSSHNAKRSYDLKDVRSNPSKMSKGVTHAGTYCVMVAHP